MPDNLLPRSLLRWYFLLRWGLGEVGKRVKISENAAFAASFWGLEGFGGYCREGVHLFWSGGVNSLWS